MTLKNLKRIHLDIPPTLVDRVDRLCENRNVKRTPFLRAFFQLCMDDAEAIDKAVKYAKNPHNISPDN